MVGVEVVARDGAVEITIPVSPEQPPRTLLRYSQACPRRVCASIELPQAFGRARSILAGSPPRATPVR